MIFLDPLEQFVLQISFVKFSTNTMPNNILNMVVLIVLLLIILVVYKYNTNSVFKLQDKVQKWNEFIFTFVADMLKNIINIKKRSFVLLVYTMFLYIFFSNIMGMIPGVVTVTSHLIFTMYLSLSFFICNNLIGIYYHKEKYFVLFLPDGVPKIIIPFLILIEYVSYFSRIFSLAIRLFANMMAGHILLKILIGFIWTFVTSGIAYWFVSIFPLGVIFVVIGLETCIALLQAYVFVVLIAIYLNDVVNTH